MSSQPTDRDLEELRQALLELYYDCSEQPALLRTRIDNEPKVAEMWREVQAQARVLDTAAHAPMPDFVLVPESPGSQGSSNSGLETPAPRTPSAWWRGWRVAASFVLAASCIAPIVAWQWNEHQVRQLSEDRPSLILSGPVGIPDVSPAYFDISPVNAKGEAKKLGVAWRALDEQGAVLASGIQEPAEHHEVVLSSALKGARSMEVKLEGDEQMLPVSLKLSPTQGAPLCHLSSDRPVYAPGDVIRFRGVLLDRISLSPMAGTFRLRLIDAKESEVGNIMLTAQEGVVAYVFSVPEHAPGGTWKLELRDAKNEFSVQTLPVQVQRNAARRFATLVDLDRKSYAPGSSGRVQVRSRRLSGGSLAGASASVRITIAGRVVDTAAGQLDDRGSVTLSFDLPETVKPAEAAAVVIIAAKDQTESVVEPFLVPPSEVLVQWYPEGGDLVADLPSRVYFEATDSSGRIIDFQGQLLDREGAYIGDAQTLHAGCGIVEIPAHSRFPLHLAFTEPKAASVALPKPKPEGISLRVTKLSTPAGDPIECNIAATEPGPWIVGVFCRGQLVGSQTAHTGTKPELVEVGVPDDVGGVLRVTVFDHELKPRAERLVHRESTQQLQLSVDVTPETARPGGKQSLAITARDEAGTPVRAMLGISVSDGALDASVRRKRIGLHDRTYLFDGIGAEDFESISALMVDNQQESLRNLDLILGTQAWRRFGWHNPDEFVAKHGTQARKALVLEGNPQTPQVADGREDTAHLLAKERGESRLWKRNSRAALGLSALCAALIVLWFKRGPKYSRPSLAWRGLGTLALGALFGVLLSPPSPDAVFLGMADSAAADDPVLFRYEASLSQKTQANADALPVDSAAILNHGLVVGNTSMITMGPDVLRGIDPLNPQIEDSLGLPVLYSFGLDQHAGLVRNSVNLFFQDELLADLSFLPADAYPPAITTLTTERTLVLQQLGQVAWTREYRHRRPEREPNAARTDFAQTLYWNPLAKTDNEGKLTVEFDLSDRITSWLVHVEGHGAFRVGQTKAEFVSRMPLSILPTWPTELTEGDRVQIPVGLSLEDGDDLAAELSSVVSGSLKLRSKATQSIGLKQGVGRALIDVEVKEGAKARGSLAMGVRAGGFRDKLARTLRITPRGFPQARSWSGSVSEPQQFLVSLPSSYRSNSLALALKFYPSPLSSVIGGLEGMLREPTGCFEQTSSKNYPNVMALQLLKTSSDGSPALINRSKTLVQRGYTRLKSFQCKDGGFDWYPGGKGKTGLSAYGLVQFQDMKRVYDVEEKLLESTKSWLLSMRDGQGGFNPGEGSRAYSARDPDTLNPYVLWALLSAHTEPSSVKAELDACEQKLRVSRDPYHLALGGLVFDLAERSEAANRCHEALSDIQAPDGSVPGARSTLTASRGIDRLVETTAMASLAWLNTARYRPQAERSVRWIMSKRNGSGTFGATQATVLAMKALVKYSESQTSARVPCQVFVQLNGKTVRTVECDPRRSEPVLVEGLSSAVNVGANLIELSVDNEDASVPYSCLLSYHSEQPADDNGAALSLAASLANEASEVIEGETVGVAVKLKNLRDEAVSNAMATIGLPATLNIESRILDQAKAAGQFAHWERRGREITLYLRGLRGEEERSFSLEATATIPGQSTGPASKAWLYYESKRVSWSAPLALKVRPRP